MTNLINRIRYRLWQLSYTRTEWVDRVIVAHKAGYGHGYAETGDSAMYRYWYENIRTVR